MKQNETRYLKKFVHQVYYELKVGGSGEGIN